MNQPSKCCNAEVIKVHTDGLPDYYQCSYCKDWQYDYSEIADTTKVDTLPEPEHQKSEVISVDTAIGMLRQWLNEERIKDASRFVTNEQIYGWLDSAIAERERLARIDALVGFHTTIMESPKYQSSEPDQAFAYARVYRLLDDEIRELQLPQETEPGKPEN